jgi:hypothetical protein
MLACQTDATSWLLPLAETMLSDDARDLMIQLAQSALADARRRADAARRVAELGQLVDDLGGDAIVLVRRPA